MSETRAPRIHPALLVEGLGHAYGGHPSLDDIGFVVQPGGFTSLLGLNGAGKTTLISCLARLAGPWRGRVQICGVDPVVWPARAMARIGVVFQEPTLDLDMTIARNLRYHAALHGLSRRRAETRIAADLASHGLARYADRKVRGLSFGIRRRAEVARALLHRPSLVLMDEAASGLDVPSRKALGINLRRRCRREGLAVLWATHADDEVRVSDGLVVLHEGRQLAAGKVGDVIEQTGRGSLRAAFSALTS